MSQRRVWLSARWLVGLDTPITLVAIALCLALEVACSRPAEVSTIVDSKLEDALLREDWSTIVSVLGTNRMTRSDPVALYLLGEAAWIQNENALASRCSDSTYNDAARKAILSWAQRFNDEHPNQAVSAYVLADVQFHQKDSTAARESVSRALTLRPDYPQALDLKGRMYQMQRMYDSAIVVLDRAIGLDSSVAGFFRHRGNLKCAMGQTAAGMLDFKRALDFSPQYRDVFLNRARAYEKAGMPDSALADCGRAIAIDPGSAEAHTQKGNLYYYKGELRKALNEFGLALAITPKDPVVRNSRGACYRQLRILDSALADFDCATQEDPKFDLAYNNRGNAYLDSGDPDRAIADYSKAVELNPRYALAYFNRGRALCDRHDYARSIDDFNNAYAIDSTIYGLFMYRGKAHLGLAEYDLALSDLDNAISKDPGEAEAY